jgi:hypothetical protein
VRRKFIAFCFESLAIRVSICFHVGSNASTEEVRMNINSKDRLNPMQRAAAAVARALLG